MRGLYFGTLDRVIDQTRWNEQVLVYPTIEQICEVNNIAIIDAPLNSYDCMTLVLNGKLILVLKDTLIGPPRLLTLIHCFTHGMLYRDRLPAQPRPPTMKYMIAACNPITDAGRGPLPEDSDELGATILGCCGLLPKPALENRTGADLVKHFGLPKSVISDRYKILWEYEL